MELVDSKYVDVKFVGGKLVLEVDAKKAAIEILKPSLEKLKAKIPGGIDDALIDLIIKEIEEA